MRTDEKRAEKSMLRREKKNRSHDTMQTLIKSLLCISQMDYSLNNNNWKKKTKLINME